MAIASDANTSTYPAINSLLVDFKGSNYSSLINRYLTHPKVMSYFVHTNFLHLRKLFRIDELQIPLGDRPVNIHQTNEKGKLWARSIYSYIYRETPRNFRISN